MELRHLDTLLAIAEEGSFTAAADALATVQSNVSLQVRQLEEELGAELFVRSRRGAIPTECGNAVLERARRIRRELEALRADLSMLQGLAAGEASFGIVGTASRWVVPALVADLRVARAGRAAAGQRGGFGTARRRGRSRRDRAGGRHRAGHRPAPGRRDADGRGARRRRARRHRAPARAGAPGAPRAARSRAPPGRQPAAARGRSARRGAGHHAGRGDRGRGHPPHR